MCEAGAFFVAAALALAASTSSAQERLPVAEALRRGQWPAFWIAAAEGPERDAAVFHFRKSVRLEAVPSRFIVHVSADNRYLLHVNGRRVGAGPARSDLLHWAFEAYDLAPDLRAGDNLVAATVWNFGTLAPMAQISRRTGFLVQGDDEAAAALNTGRAWEGALDPGHGPNPSALGPLRARHFYYAAGPGERRDGSLFDWEWDEPGARSSRWRPAREIGHAYPHAMRDGPGWMLSPEGWLLEPSSIPPMEHREIGGGRVVRSTSLRRVEAACLHLAARSRWLTSERASPDWRPKSPCPRRSPAFWSGAAAPTMSVRERSVSKFRRPGRCCRERSVLRL